MNYQDQKFSVILEQSDEGRYANLEDFRDFLKRKITGVIPTRSKEKKEKELIKKKEIGHRCIDAIGTDGKSKDITKELKDRRNYIQGKIIQDRLSK